MGSKCAIIPLIRSTQRLSLPGRKVTLITEAIKTCGVALSQKQAQIAKHQAKVAALELEAESLKAEVKVVSASVPRPRCTKPCGKLRYTSSKSAMRANKHNDKSIRPYYDARCHIWHVTKGSPPDYVDLYLPATSDG